MGPVLPPFSTSRWPGESPCAHRTRDKHEDRTGHHRRDVPGAAQGSPYPVPVAHILTSFCLFFSPLLCVVPGPVFGSKDNFHGLAIFLDTYPNDEATERVFPYISAMVNNGSLSYDHSKDGRWTELAGCSADLRNQNHDTFLAVRYSRGRLTVMTDVEDKNEWKNCIDIAGVQLPTGYFFGASAGTGDLSDNHDIISMKLFQLMVEHPVEDEAVDWTKIEPRVSLLKSPKDNVDDPTGNFRSGPLTGWKVFLLLLCALLGIIVCAVVGAVVFQKRQERNKRFY
nr:vesicular integral-membrane protein VIP36 [Zonotrichia albicollis]